MIGLHSKRFLGLAMLTVLLIGCERSAENSSQRPATESAATAVARWSGGELSREEFLAWTEWQQLEPTAETADRLAMLHSLAEAAERRGLDASPRVRIEQAIALQGALLPLLDRDMDAQVVVTDEEIEALRLENPQAFQRPRRLLLRGIHKTLPKSAEAAEALRQRMRDLRAAVADGASLEQLALQESESQSRYREGSIGFVDPAILPDPVRRAVEGLATGELSSIIEHDGGISFYRCERIQEAILPTTEEVRANLRQNLFRQRRNELGEALNRTLAASVSIDPSGDPLVTVGEDRLPAAWLDALIAHRLPDRDPAELTPPQIRRLLGEWAHRVALAQHAHALGLDADPRVQGAQRWAGMHALATAELRHRVDAGLAESAPSEDALLELYRQHAPRLRHPAEQYVAVVQFAGPEDMSDPARIAAARRVVEDIDRGRLPFAAAAREYSIHPSAANGGDLGWLQARQLGSLDVGILKPVRLLEPGRHTGLLRLTGGLWLVQLIERRPARPLSFEEARERLLARHRRERIRSLESEVQQKHREQIGLQVLIGD